MTQLLWTCLPNGLHRDSSDDPWQVHFSVFLTPRLSGGADSDVLASYSDFLDWPRNFHSKASPLPFEVQLHDGSQVVHTLQLSSVADIEADSLAWQSIFPRSTRVTAFTPPPTKARQGAQVQSYPASELLNSIRSVYSSTLARQLGVRSAGPSLASFNLPANSLSAPAPVNESPVEAFARFFQSADDKMAKVARKNDDEEADFHQIVSALGSYPLLLRKLGLVFDFHASLSEFPVDALKGTARIRVKPAASLLPGIDHQPFWTAISVAPEGSSNYREFAAASASAGRTRAADSFGLASASVALEKVEHAAFALIQQARSEPDDVPKVLPALLQGGMRIGSPAIPLKVRTAILEQTRLEQSLQASLAQPRGASDAGDDEELLYAEQLQRGIRVDVRDVSTGEWRSLCARDNRFAAGDWQWPESDNALLDEGVVEPTVFRDDNDRIFSAKVTEDLFEWDGWSLVVPRSDNSADKVQALQQARVAASGTPLSVATTVAQGSLQPQRFGRHYQFRIRSVDLAGNSISTEQAAEMAGNEPGGVHVTEPSCYLRVESAKPPVVFRAQPRALGEAGDTIVLRDAERASLRSSDFAVHVLPPEVPLRIAEKHGVFDGLDAKEAWQLIESHRGKLEVDEHGERREALTENEVYAPYLPDPMCQQAVLKIPGVDNAVDLPRFDAIPKKLRGKKLARSVQIEFRASKGELSSRLRGRRLIVDVPPGRVLRFSLAAKLGDEQLSQSALAHPDWQCQESGLNDAMPALKLAAASGNAPMLAPEQVITVVHATQRPMTAPVIDGVSVKAREAGSVKADLDLQALQLDRPSSGRLDVYARWQDPVDHEGTTGFAQQAGELYVGGLHVPEDDAALLTPSEEPRTLSPLSHDFGDTRYHRVRYRAVAQSRFIEFYPETLTGDPDKLTRSSDWLSLDVPATVAPDAPDIRYVVPLLHQRHDINKELNLQKERSGEYGGAGLRVYLNRGWFSSGAGEKLALILANSKTDAALDDIVSDWGSNPLHVSAALPGRMSLAHVAGGTERMESVQFLGTDVSMLMFDVQFSEERGLPFVDIPFAGQKAFMPMLRLGLVRYQKHAIDNCHFSAAVQTDFVPLTPERSMTVQKLGADRWRLSIRGFGYDVGQADRNGSLMQVQVEVLPSSAAANSTAWRAIGEPQNVVSKPEARWQHHWDGEIHLQDASYLSPSWRRRLAIRELEILHGDTSPEALQRARVVSAQTVRI